MTFTADQLHNIQGLGIAGYRKDLQHLVFIRFGDPDGARRLLKWLHPRAAIAWEVRRFNELYSEMRRRDDGNGPPIQATWMGVLISAPRARDVCAVAACGMQAL